jgi:hypothetical protein
MLYSEIYVTDPIDKFVDDWDFMDEIRAPLKRSTTSSARSGAAAIR